MKRTTLSKALVLALLFVMGLVLAAGTPAGTEIRNQASASYTDSAGQPQTTTSNEVVTMVQPVYDFTITPNGTEAAPGQTKTGLQGAPVYFNYTVTNNGNTPDTINLTAPQGSSDDFDFDSVKIYLDTNCNGTIDPGEAEVSSVDLNADESACVIVEAVIPAGEADGHKGHANLSGTSAGDSTLTDNDNWAEAVVTSKAVLDAAKSANPSGEVAPGDTIDYSIQGSNKGGSAAGAITGVATVDGTAKDGILISDEIPAGTTYVLGSASGSAGGGTTSVIYMVNGSWTATEPGTASDVTKVGLLIEGTGAFFPQGAQYQLNFQVTVNAGTAANTAIENTATVEFDADGDGNGGGTGEEVDSNTTSNPVAAVYEVANGPQDDPDSDGTGFTSTYTDPSGNTWNYSETTDTTDPRDDDAETITDDVYGGDTVFFPFTLENNGNTPDSYDLSLNIVDPDTTDGADPSTWTCQVMASDGTTPISGSIGPINPGDSFDYVVKCSIPADYEETGGSDAAHIEVTATSEGDPNVSNKVTGIVTDVQSGYGVDAADHGNSNDNDPSNDNPPAQSADPGDTVTVPFDVTNTGHNPDTYDLTTDLPTGWGGTVYPDSDCDGQMDDPAPAPVADTGLLNEGETACFVLVVDVPDDESPVDLDGNPGTTDDNVKITATSNADPSVTDTISTDVEVNAVSDLDFSPDRNGTVTSPGTIVYTHTVTNNGNEDASVTFSQSGSTHPTWTYQISTDGGNTWTDVGSASAITLAPGASQDVQVRVIVPDGEPIGAIDTNQISANATYTNAPADSASVTDTTTVVGGDLRVEKKGETCADASCTNVTSADASEAKPGEYIHYTVTASNIGTADLKKVIVSDPLPGHTDFVSVSASTSVSGAQVLFSTDGTTWSTSAPTSLSAGQAVFVALDSDSNGTIDDSDLLPPGESITLEFTVQVQ